MDEPNKFSPDSQRLTWADLVRIEPRLTILARRAATTGRQESHWVAIKHGLDNLCGWNAKDERLASSEVRDFVYDHLREIWERRPRA
jgi:hypothetical protein